MNKRVVVIVYILLVIALSVTTPLHNSTPQVYNVDGTQTTLTPILNQTINITGGTILAPHLYIAHVNGCPLGIKSCNYIDLGGVQPYNGSYAIMSYAWGVPNVTLNPDDIVFVAIKTGYGLYQLDTSGLVYARGRDPFTNDLYHYPSIKTHSKIWGLGENYSLGETFYVDLDEINTLNDIQHGWGYKIKLGNDLDWDTTNTTERTQDPSYWGYFILWTHYVEPSVIQSMMRTNIITDSNTTRFFDPTAFNGTNYFDLVNSSMVYTPYGNVQRVKANSTWIWVLENARNDGFVHLEWFPTGSVVRFVDNATGSVVKEVYIDNSSKDYAISIPDGVYNVEVDVVSTYRFINSYAYTEPSNPNLGDNVIVHSEFIDVTSGVITGLNVSATVTRPDNRTSSIVLRDDGVYPDDIAGDGVYSGLYNQTNITGKYRVDVYTTIEGENITAYTTFNVGSSDVLRKINEVDTLVKFLNVKNNGGGSGWLVALAVLVAGLGVGLALLAYYKRL